MEGSLNGMGEMVPGQRVLEGTDLDIAYNREDEDPMLRVNKAGVLVFRVQLKEAVEGKSPVGSCVYFRFERKP
jgi:hypothetical protein